MPELVMTCACCGRQFSTGMHEKREGSYNHLRWCEKAPEGWEKDPEAHTRVGWQ